MMKTKLKKEFRFTKSITTDQVVQDLGNGFGEVLKNPEDEPPFYVRGIKAGSKDEYWVSLNLERIEKITGWTWEYQVPVFGGRGRQGGSVLDFIVHTPGRRTILDPMGRPWHTGRREDRFQMEEAARRLKMDLIAWFTDQTPTRESQYQFLRAQLHV